MAFDLNTKMATKKQPYSVARYEAQVRRTKQRLALKLLRIMYPDHVITTEADNAYVQKALTHSAYCIGNFVSTLCDHVHAYAWEKLPEQDRYPALKLLVPTEYHTPVPGGMVYQVRFANDKRKSAPHVPQDEWVFLSVGHAIGRCKLVPQTLAARVF